MYELLKELIRPELVTLIPVLYLIGIGLKKSENTADKHIPLWLGGISVVLTLMYMVSTNTIATYRDAAAIIFSAITQGILCAGASVYINQIIKQAGK